MIKTPKTVTLKDIHIHSHHLDIFHEVDHYVFQTKVFYPSTNLIELNQSYGQDAMGKIYATIALCETFKFCALFPKEIDLSRIKYLSKSEADFFLSTYQKSYTQCMYENNISDYVPKLIMGLSSDNVSPFKIKRNENSEKIVLIGNGGGKDGFLAMKLFEESNLPYATYHGTRAEYGRSQYQHQLHNRVLQHTSPVETHNVSVYDDFTESPFIKTYYPDLNGPFTTTIIESIFNAIPVMLQKGYESLCFANEKSSDTGNLFWQDREVNHQWVKSLDCELYFQQYIRESLLINFDYFSVLKPIYDYRIFQHLSHYPEFIKNSHSCNVDKPWCKKCPKCAYVWLGFLAHFDKSLVDKIFHDNPFDDDDLIIHFKNMTGIEGHRSFECVGNIEECQLFMKKCIEKGLTGKMLELFKEKILLRDLDWQLLEEKYSAVYQAHNIPAYYFEKLEGRL